MSFWDFEKTDCDKIGNMSQVAGIRRYEFKDGKAKGVEVAEVHTASGLEFTVLPGRGMDIAWAKYRGIPLSYISKTGIVAPEYYENSGMEWLHSFFAGALTTCGLLNVGNPQKVQHPVIGEREYGLHGRISNCAAEQISVYEEWEDDEYVMKVSGVVSEGTLHGEHLTLRREIVAKHNKSEFVIRDVVTNRAANPQNIMLLYHINMGYPLVDKDSRIVTNSKSITGQSEEAKNDIDNVFTCSEPILNIAEKGYSHDMNIDSEGKVRVAIINDRLNIGVAIEYKKNQLPYFNEWKVMNKKEYVVGFEPGTSLPVGVNEAEKLGMKEILLPNESKNIEITYKILDGTECISAYEKSIRECK